MALCELILGTIISRTAKSLLATMERSFCLLDSFDAVRKHVLRDLIDQK
jgi:hypothetical protein